MKINKLKSSIKNYILSINMIVKCYIASYIRKSAILIFLNLICLSYFTNSYASDVSLEDKELEAILINDEDINNKLRLNNDPETQLDIKLEDFPSELAKYYPKDKLNKEIFCSLDRILHTDGFDLNNGRWWVLKFFLYLFTPFSCGANTLIIAKTNDITAKLILAAQFTVPRTIESICSLTDQLRLVFYENQLKIWWSEKIIKNKKTTGIPKLIFTILKLGASIGLAYAYALIDAETAGDAYRWIAESFTSDEYSLNRWDNTGEFLNFSYTALLGAIFFFQLIEEFITKGSFMGRTLINYCRGRQAENQDLEYEALVDTINDLRAKTEIVCRYENSQEQIDDVIKEHLSDRGLNSMNTIASLQKYLGPDNKPNSIKVNLSINSAKLIFIVGATIICGVSFKYIFASGTILRNYVNSVGNKQNNGSYIFNLKNGGHFLCDSVDDCTDGVDFNKIFISDSQKDKLLELNAKADLANILQGIAISADTAVLIISSISLVCSLCSNPLLYRALKIGFFRKSKIIPVLGAALILPAMIFYLENVNNVIPIAKTSNRLLKSTGQDAFVGVDVGIGATIVVLGATFSLGARLLSNVPHAIWSIPGKVIDFPNSSKKILSGISRCFK